MIFWSSSWIRPLILWVLVLFTFTVQAGAGSPSWSTYHGQQIKKLQVSDTGITLGLTGGGAVFLLARDSRFIASWSRDAQHTLKNFSLSQEGDYAAICYDDGYTALFTHDGQEGRSLWAYNISQAQPSTLVLEASGSYLGIASTPMYQEEERSFSRPSTLYLFSQEGRDIWRRTLDSHIVSIDVNQKGWTVVGGNTYETPQGIRGRQALYLYDGEGNLIWDRMLEEAVERVGFNSRGILVLTSDNRFSLYDLEGELSWELVEEVEEAQFSPKGYAAGFYQNKVFLITPDGERAWVFGIDGLKTISLSDIGMVAVLTDRDVTLWNEEGREVFYYQPEEEIYSLALCSQGRYLILGLNRVSQFLLPH